MAHVSQEAAPGSVRGFGSVFGTLQFLFHSLLPGQILHDAAQIGRFLIVRPQA
jgi:hypothetical protein